MKIKEFANYIIKQREERGLSQRQLAKMSCISNTEVSKIENSLRQDISLETIKKISYALRTPFFVLLEILGYIGATNIKIGTKEVVLIIEDNESLKHAKSFLLLSEKAEEIKQIDNQLWGLMCKAILLPPKERDKIKEYVTMLLQKNNIEIGGGAP